MGKVLCYGYGEGVVCLIYPLFCFFRLRYRLHLLGWWRRSAVIVSSIPRTFMLHSMRLDYVFHSGIMSVCKVRGVFLYVHFQHDWSFMLPLWMMKWRRETFKDFAYLQETFYVLKLHDLSFIQVSCHHVRCVMCLICAFSTWLVIHVAVRW